MKWLSKSREAKHEAEDTIAFVETGGDGPGSVGDAAAAMPPDAPAPRAQTEPTSITRGLRDRVVEHLLNQGKVTEKQIQQAQTEWRQHGEDTALWRILARNPQLDREYIYAEAARIYAFRQEEIGEGRPDLEFVKRVLASLSIDQREELGKLGLLPLENEIDPARGVLKLLFATHDPTHPETLRFIHELRLEHFELCYAPEAQLAPLLEQLFPRRNEYLERVAEDDRAFEIGTIVEQAGRQLVDETKLDAEINRSVLINLFEAALVEAVRMGASDIHIWPNPHKQTEIHFRIDGELQPWHTEDKVHPEAMLAVVKDRCMNVDRFEREAAQDGYIQRYVDDALIRYRVSILPITTATREIKAESIVIRVLDDRKMFSDLSAIGLLPGALTRFEKAIRQPNGMIIMTGPTGSGKSTTLVAALHQVMRPQLNVLTIEDPVEYVINGVRQIKLGVRLELESALRAVLRHDPDVVMVGEMRDRPTAELAIKLANTGHLTFSTLHTNDAASAVSRLYKMGIEPFLIAYAINLIVAQRLLRTLCSSCKQVDHDPDVPLLEELGFSEEEIETTTFYKPRFDITCPKCRGVGYQGRRAISEALYFTRPIRQLIISAGGTINDDDIRDAAVKDGMLTLLASGREIVKRGETSVDEILRVVTADD